MISNIWSKFITNIDNKKVIVDVCGDVINNNPTEKELRELRKYVRLPTRYILKLPESDKKEYLLEFLRHFYKKKGRVPVTNDFNNNPKYPSCNTYFRIFGSWDNAIRDAGLLDKRTYTRNSHPKYTDETLLRYLILFYEENGRPPTKQDFNNNPKYPSVSVYNRFGSWSKSLKLVNLDVDSMVIKGVLDTTVQKARLAEIFVKEHFIDKDKVKDLSGLNQNSPFDGICPKSKNYDVKSSKLYTYDYNHWKFTLDNIKKDEIEWYYLLAFNEDFMQLLHVWRVLAWEFLEKRTFDISANQGPCKMKEYEITERFIPLFDDWVNNIKKK